MLQEDALYLFRVDVLAAAVEHIVDTAFEIKETFRVTAQDVAGAQPTVDEALGVDLGQVVISRRIGRAFQPELADVVPVLAVGADQANLRLRHDRADRARRDRPAVERRRQAAAGGLRQAVALGARHAEDAGDLLHQFGMGRRGAEAQHLQAGEVQALQQVALLQQHGEHGRHAARLCHPVFRDRLQVGARVEAAHQNDRSAGAKLRLERHGHGVLVVERRRDKPALFGVCRPMLLPNLDQPGRIAVGQRHALGPAGRARGVGMEGRRLRRDRDRRELGRGRRDRRPEGRPARGGVAERQLQRNGRRGVREMRARRRFDDHGLGAGVG